MNLPYEDRLCTKCSSADIGDEFHYDFSCPFFADSWKNIFYHFIVKMQMLIDFSHFCSKKKRLLVNLAHCLKFIMNEFWCQEYVER